MPRRLRAMMANANATMANANAALASSGKLMIKGDLIADLVIALLEDLQDEGIEIGLEIVGTDIPVEIEIRIGDDDRMAARVKGLDKIDWGALWQKVLDKFGDIDWAALLTKVVAFLLPLIMGAMKKDDD